MTDPLSKNLQVVVLGGYGFFGSRIVTLLAREAGLTVWVAGRDAVQAQALVDTANQHSATPPPPDDDGANDLAVAPPPADPATKATPAAAVTGTPTAAVAADPASSSATSASDRPAEGQPVYKKWWFWTAIGGGVAAVVVVGVVAGVASQGSSALPSGVPTIMFRL